VEQALRIVPRYLVLAAVIALLGCTTSSPRAVDYTQDCSGPGMTPGTDEFKDCVDQHQLQQKEDRQRVRQLRESLGGGAVL
jgi:hypothetical protein